VDDIPDLNSEATGSNVGLTYDLPQATSEYITTAPLQIPFKVSFIKITPPFGAT
jgi:hypothetical protein